jgi:hypothetical protein
MTLGAVVHPPENLNQGLGMLFPAAMLLNYALKGPRRALAPARKPAPAPAPAVSDSDSRQA